MSDASNADTTSRCVRPVPLSEEVRSGDLDRAYEAASELLSMLHTLRELLQSRRRGGVSESLAVLAYGWSQQSDCFARAIWEVRFAIAAARQSVAHAGLQTAPSQAAALFRLSVKTFGQMLDHDDWRENIALAEDLVWSHQEAIRKIQWGDVRPQTWGLIHAVDATSELMTNAKIKTWQKKLAAEIGGFDSDVAHAELIGEFARAVAARLDGTTAEGKAKRVDVAPTIRWSEDFSSCFWGREQFFFSPTQIPIVHALWKARCEGGGALRGQHLLSLAESRMADSPKPQLRRLFRNNQAWNKMIVSAGKGLYRIADPAKNV